MQIETLERILEIHEGIRLHPYEDSVEKITIGIGRNLDDVGISKNEAYMMLGHDINRATQSLINILGKDNYNSLSAVRKEALVDMIFNLGAGSFSEFKNMIKAIKHGNHYKASREMLKSNWADQVGKRAKDISEAYKDSEWKI